MEKHLSGATVIFQLVGLQFFSLDAESFTDKIIQKNQVSKKHKFFILITVLAMSLQGFGIMFAIQLEKQHGQNENVTTAITVQFVAYVMMLIVIVVSVFHAFCKMGKTKKIFCNFEKILITFVNELDTKIDYANFARRSMLSFYKVTFSFVLLAVSLHVFVYSYNQSNVFLWAVLTIYPHFFLEVVDVYFMFFIMLVTENLKTLLEVLLKIHKLRGSTDINIGLHFYVKDGRKKNDEMFNDIQKLKRIYGILADTTCLINEVMGLPFMIQLVLMVLANVSAGYKIYLSFMGDVPVERIGGKIKHV